MAKLIRTTSEDPSFQNLVHLLDQDLELRNGNQHAFYAQFNKIDMIKHVVIYYDNDIAIGCGAFKPFEAHTVEIKRMFVKQNFRGKGIAASILKELELWASELNYTACVLETGKMQPEAIRLYQKSGYSTIANFGQYANVENSVCMRKSIA